MRDAGTILRKTLLLAVAVATLFVARLGWAADKWVVIWSEGPDSDAIAKDVKEQLPKGLTAVDAKQFKDALAKAGHKGPIGKQLDPKNRDKFLEKVRKAADDSKIEGVIIVRTQKDKKGRTATLLVIDPKSSTPLRDDEVSLPAKKSKDDGKAVLASAGSALEKLAPAPEKAPEPAKPAGKADAKADAVAAKPDEKPEASEDKPKEEDKPEPAGARPTGEPSRALVIFGAGFELGLRSFSYNQPITSNNRGYDVVGAPMLGLNLEAYPLAGVGGPAGDIGITGTYSRAVALQSAPQGGEKLTTTWDRFTVGLRYRLRLSGDKGPVLYVGGAYGQEQFTFSGAEGRLANEVPAAKYRFIKAGLDARIPIGPVAIMAGAGWLFASAEDKDATTVSGRYPRADLGGVEANLGFAVGLFKGLEARALARYTRFFYSMNPEPGDPYVAGGALDNLGSLHIGAAYVY